MSRWDRLIYIKDKVLANLRSPLDDTMSIFERLSMITKKSEASSMAGKIVTKRSKEHYKSFSAIKRKLNGISSLSVKLAQTVLVFKMSDGGEVNLCLARLNSHLYVSNRPERLTNVATLESLTLGVKSSGYQKLLLNPWTVSVEVCLFWESWQQQDSNPQVHVTAESDCFVLDVSPEQIRCVEVLLKELQEFVAVNLQGDYYFVVLILFFCT